MNMIKLFYSKEVVKLKKTIKLIIYTLFICLIGIINVNAASLSFDGDRIVAGGNTGSNDIVINVGSEQLKKVEFTVSVTDSSLVALTLTKNSSLAGDVNLSKSTLNIVGEDSYFTSGSVATLRITNNNLVNTATTTKIIISNIVFTDKEGKTTTGTDFTKEITLTPGATTKPKSNNAKLTGLSLSSGSLTPEFNGATTSYKVFNLKDTIKSVTITTKCDLCNVKIKCETGCTNYNNQNKPELIIGKNILQISTISEDGSNNSEYELIIYRGETTDNSPFLANLEIEDFKLLEKFIKDNLDYTLTVPNDTESLNIIATPEDEYAKVEIKGADNLIIGENVITITITSSETSDKKIYNITVTRLEEGEVMTTTQPVITPISKKDNQTLLIVIISVVSLAIIGVAGYFIFRKKKQKKGKPETITDEGKIKPTVNQTEVEVRENDLIDDLNITEEKTKPTVDEALADLMSTKEIIFKEE